MPKSRKRDALRSSPEPMTTDHPKAPHMPTSLTSAPVELRVGRLESEMTHLSAAVETIGLAQKEIGTKIDQTLQLMGGLQAYQTAHKPVPTWDVIKTGLAILQSAALLMGMTVAGIVYIASNSNNDRLAVMKYQLEELREFRREASALVPRSRPMIAGQN